MVDSNNGDTKQGIKVMLKDLEISLALTADKANQEIEKASKGVTAYAVAELNIDLPILSADISSEAQTQGETIVFLPTPGQQTPHALKITLKAIPKIETAKVDVARLPFEVLMSEAPIDTEKLSRACLVTVGDLAQASPNKLAKMTGISIEIINKYIEAAKSVIIAQKSQHSKD